MQESRRQFEVLLRMGAEVAGSPAAEQLAQQVRQYLHVRRFIHGPRLLPSHIMLLVPFNTPKTD